jgi:hypothetical protein
MYLLYYRFILGFILRLIIYLNRRSQITIKCHTILASQCSYYGGGSLIGHYIIKFIFIMWFPVEFPSVRCAGTNNKKSKIIIFSIINSFSYRFFLYPYNFRLNIIIYEKQHVIKTLIFEPLESTGTLLVNSFFL